MKRPARLALLALAAVASVLGAVGAGVPAVAVAATVALGGPALVVGRGLERRRLWLMVSAGASAIAAGFVIGGDAGTVVGMFGRGGVTFAVLALSVRRMSRRLPHPGLDLVLLCAVGVAIVVGHTTPFEPGADLAESLLLLAPAIASALCAATIGFLDIVSGPRHRKSNGFLAGSAIAVSLGDTMRVVGAESPAWLSQLPDGLWAAGGILLLAAFCESDLVGDDAALVSQPSRVELTKLPLRSMAPAIAVPFSLFFTRLVVFSAPSRATLAMMMLVAALLGWRLQSLLAANTRQQRVSRQRERRLRSLLEVTSDVILVVDDDDCIEYVSESVLTSLGWSPGSVLGQPIEMLIQPESRPDLARTVAETRSAQGGTARCELGLKTSSADLVWADVSVKDHRHDESVKGMVVSFRDATARRRSEVILSQAAARQAAIARVCQAALEPHGAAGLGEIAVDLIAKVLGATSVELWEVRSSSMSLVATSAPADVGTGNPLAFNRSRTGLPSAALGRRTTVFDEATVAHPMHEVEHPTVVVVEFDTPSSARRAFDVEFVESFCSAWMNAERRRRAEERLYHQANHDALTGLANRSRFMTELEQVVAAGVDGRSQGATVDALLFCDLDGFKVVNDTWGHEVGDAILLAVSDRLASVVTDRDLVARLGGDEFTILSRSFDLDAARRLARSVSDVVSAPIHIGGRELAVGVSVGLTVIGTEDSDVSEVLQRADRAMYQSKRASPRPAPAQALEQSVAQAEAGMFAVDDAMSTEQLPAPPY